MSEALEQPSWPDGCVPPSRFRLCGADGVFGNASYILEIIEH